MKCPVCGREASRNLCPYHSAAKEKIEAAYPLWIEAYGRIEWMKFLDSIKRNVQTGRWAKETAGYLQGV